jgi:squalene-hopene/tetraprenyl-beta-curcumene cyclase
VNRTFSHIDHFVSERDAAWFEELAGTVARGRAALLARARTWAPEGDAAASLVALIDAGQSGNSPECEKAVRRLRAYTRPPDTGETAAALVALWRSGYAVRAACGPAVFDGINRVLDRQNRDGGWGACDNVQTEPSCPAATALALEALGYFGFRAGQRPVAVAVRFLLARQEADGGWLSLVGENGTRDTAQVFAGLRAIDFDMSALVVRRAVRWLKETQSADGGWGEPAGDADSTAWALLGLLAADEADSAEVRAGAEFLVGTQRADGGWGAAVHLPLTALARYAGAVGANRTRRDTGHRPPAPKSPSSRLFADNERVL